MNADTTHLLAEVDMRLIAALGILTNPVPIDGPTRANLRTAITGAIVKLHEAQNEIGVPRRRADDPLMGEVVLPPIEPAPELSFDRFGRRAPQLVGVHATSPAALRRDCACINGLCRGGEVVNGRLANGMRCKAHRIEGAELIESEGGHAD
jgi:hypothetical protein